MLHAVPSAALQNIQEADQVAVHVSMRVLYRVAYAHLGRKMNNNLRLYFFEQFLHPHSVCQIQQKESEFPMRFEKGEPVFFELHVIIGIQVVHACDIVAFLQKSLGQVKPDETGIACNQYFHNLPYRCPSREFSFIEPVRMMRPARTDRKPESEKLRDRHAVLS
jgi:hypothetical protein